MRGRQDAAEWASNEYFALRTFRSDGSTVAVPIWLAPAGEHLFGYTPARSWKVRRISQNARVEVAPSDFHGEPTGAWHQGRARILGPDEARVAKRALVAKYGRQFRFFTVVLFVARLRRHGGRPVGLEITLDAGPAR